MLQLMTGRLQPSGGSVVLVSTPYYIPQHTGMIGKTVAELLCVSEKLNTLDAIMKGSISQLDYDMLANDWEIGSRCKTALSYWQLPHVTMYMSVDNLSDGEKMKVFLASC